MSLASTIIDLYAVYWALCLLHGYTTILSSNELIYGCSVDVFYSHQ